MDEASIVSALQEDLQDYKVKTQIRRRESELHVLITRSDGDDLDYASLYDIVKRRIDKLSIVGADSLVVYGRLAGAKHPEWQKTSNVKPPLPLIELDLDELEELGDLEDIEKFGDLTFSVEIDEPEVENLEPDSLDDLIGFKNSIESDLKTSSKQIGGEKSGDEKADAFDLGELGLEELKLNDLTENTFELDDLEPNTLEPNTLEPDTFEPDTFELDMLKPNSFDSSLPDLNLPDSIDLNNQVPNTQSPATIEESWAEDDFNLDAPTVAIRTPLPPPPIKPKTSSSEGEKNPKSAQKALRKSSLTLPSIAFVAVAIAILGTCGWLVWERSIQQKYLENARNIENQNLNAQKITKLESLTETRNQLQTTVSQLEEIPDRPTSLYADAKIELTTLRPKLEDFDRKINVEQGVNKKLESAKNLTLEAAKLVQNAPHKSTVWKSAQEKRQQAIKMLEVVPANSILYVDAQKRLKTYQTELAQIGRRSEIQQRAESAANSVSPDMVKQLKQLKAKVPEKQQFLPQCKTILQPQLSSAEAQRVGFPVGTLSESLCAYFWDS